MLARFVALGALVVALFALAGMRERPLASPTPAPLASAHQTSPVVTPTSSFQPPAPRVGLRALHVTDGDTIILTDGRHVRYIGIDTPELTDPRLRDVAAAAAEANRRHVEGGDLRLELDVREFDRYGRTLAYVWVGEQMVNEELLREGLAKLLTIPPDVRYVDRFRVAAAEGATKRTALWVPRDGGRVAGSRSGSSRTCPSDKPVKGNINRRGERIYHVPTGEFYGRTNPEECFADSVAAERAGFRASRR